MNKNIIEIIPPGTMSLGDLAERIKAEHGAATEAMSRGLAHAMAAGDLLIEAKARLKHGEWLPWLYENTAVKERTAQAYMRLANNRAAIESAGSADLSADDALKMLAAPKAKVIETAIDVAGPWLPTGGKLRVGILDAGRESEWFGIYEDEKAPGYYFVIHHEWIDVEDRGPDSFAGIETTIGDPKWWPHGRPVRGDFVGEWFKHVSRRRDQFDRIEWEDREDEAAFIGMMGKRRP